MSDARSSPRAVLDLELSARAPEVPSTAALVLVRVHGAPLGTLDLPPGPPDEARLVDAVREQFGPALRAHLAADGLPDSGQQGLPLVPAAARCSWAEGPPSSLAVVVCTRSRPEELRRALASLAALHAPRPPVIVVDNTAGDPATRSVVDSAGFDVRYLVEPQPGLSRARNAGVLAADTEVVAFTDDDVTVDPDWARALAEPFADPTVWAVTGLTMPAELETQPQVWFEEFGGFSRGFDRVRYDPPDLRPSALYPYTPGRFGSGVNMALRRSAVLDLGGFDPRLGAGTPSRGGEDLDMFLEVLLGGGALVYSPRALVWHRHRRERRALVRQVRDYGIGLTAMLTKRLLSSRSERISMARRAAAAARHVLSPHSEKNRYKSPDFPPSLTRWERVGMLSGPLAFTRSRRAVRAAGGGRLSRPRTDATSERAPR